MEMNELKKGSIRKGIIIRFIMLLLIFGLAFFLPARTIGFWQAWVYTAVIFSCAAGTVAYFLKHDPGLLERRMKTKEKLKEQKLIIRIGWFLYLPTFLIPGFDRFYGWSDVPVVITVISNVLVLAGYLLVIRVFKENSYTSRVVEVEKGQRVITSGPYSVVRHPMYSGVLLMYGATPMALGSWWALIGSLLIYILIIFRIFSEERYLSENLEGYKEYLLKIKYRIIPGIW